VAPALHSEIQPLAFLLGTWRGEGVGVYPTIEDFAYLEEIEIDHVGKPFLVYRQKTRRKETGEPLHTEVGYYRAPSPSTAELVIAQPTGVAEIHTGVIDGTRVSLRSLQVACTPSAKRVDSVERDLVVDGDELRYELFMSAVGQPHQIHLRATLRRT